MHLAGVLGFDKRTESVCVIGTDPQPVDVVQQVERFRAKLKSCSFVIDLNCLHEAQVQGNGSRGKEAVSPEADRTRRDRIGSCGIGVRRQLPTLIPVLPESSPATQDKNEERYVTAICSNHTSFYAGVAEELVAENKLGRLLRWLVNDDEAAPVPDRFENASEICLWKR